MKFRQIPWKFNEIPWNSVKIYEILSNFVKKTWNSVKLNTKSKIFCEFLFQNIYVNPQQSKIKRSKYYRPNQVTVGRCINSLTINQPISKSHIRDLFLVTVSFMFRWSLVLPSSWFITSQSLSSCDLSSSVQTQHSTKNTIHTKNG